MGWGVKTRKDDLFFHLEGPKWNKVDRKLTGPLREDDRCIREKVRDWNGVQKGSRKQCNLKCKKLFLYDRFVWRLINTVRSINLKQGCLYYVKPFASESELITCAMVELIVLYNEQILLNEYVVIDIKMRKYINFPAKHLQFIQLAIIFITLHLLRFQIIICCVLIFDYI